MLATNKSILSAMSSYADRFNQCLARPGKSRSGVARSMGVSPQAVRAIVIGDTKSATAANNAAAAAYFGCDPTWLASGAGDPGWGAEISDTDNAAPAGVPRASRPTPVVGQAKLGDDGFYERLDSPDGWVEGYNSTDPDAYALRVRGDSMHPAIRHGSFVVVEPGGRCVVGEYVAIALRDGRKMVKELVIERPDEVIVESVNGNHRRTLERSEIESLHQVAAVVAASKWRPS